MRYAIAAIGLLGAICSALSYTWTPVAMAHHNVLLINVVWGLYYGIGFEPVFVWYKIHGPFPSNFWDLFAMFIYPVIASIILYLALFELSARRAWRKWVIAGLAISFLVVVPMSIPPVGDFWEFPIFAFGAMGEPP